MKEFDLEAAKNGAPICTRDGRKARIVCYDAKIDHFPLFVLIDNDGIEQGFAYNEQGHRPYTDGDNDPNDLMMVPVKHDGWVSIIYDECGYRTGFKIFGTKEEAEKFGAAYRIAVAKIEWEE